MPIQGKKYSKENGSYSNLYVFNSLFLDKRERMSRHTGHHRIMEPLEPTALVMMVLEAV